MKQRILAVGFGLLALIMVVLINTTKSAQPIHQLYVFGDSLSDVGNVFRATGGLYPPNPPYFKGRYSNGPVWVEQLANRLKLVSEPGSNLACGGATTGSNSTMGVPGLLVQVQNFKATHPQANPNALYVIWAGANDYLQGVNSPEPTIANLSTAIQTLINLGANKFLVANLPDLGNLPATRNSASASALSALTKAHNLRLSSFLERLQQQSPDLQLLQMDAATLYRTAIADPAKFGFTDVRTACLEQSASCPNPERFLFWDGIHPTTAAHTILAEAAFSAVSQTSDSRAIAGGAG